MIRTIIAVTLVVLYLLLSLPILLVFWIMAKFTPKARWWYQYVAAGLMKSIMFVAGVKLTVIGREKIPTDTAALFVGNHQSYFDVISGYSLMRRQTGFVAKDSLKKVPVLSWNMLFLNCLFIDRNNLRQGVKTIKHAADLAKEGTSFFIYPEGTRNKSGDETNLAPFHDGSFMIALRGNVPIIPVAFNNTESIFEKQFPKLVPSKIVVEFGDPVYIEDLDKDEKRHIGEHFRGVVLDMIKKNQELTK